MRTIREAISLARQLAQFNRRTAFAWAHGMNPPQVANHSPGLKDLARYWRCEPDGRVIRCDWRGMACIETEEAHAVSGGTLPNGLRENELGWLQRAIASIDDTLALAKQLTMPEAVGLLMAELVSAQVDLRAIVARRIETSVKEAAAA